MPLTQVPGVAVGVWRDDISPLRELRPVAGGHVLKVLGHPNGQVVLLHDLRVGLPELGELLDELVVTKDGIRVVGRVVDDPSELGGGSANAQARGRARLQELFFFIVNSPFVIFRRLFCEAYRSEGILWFA